MRRLTQFLLLLLGTGLALLLILGFWPLGRGSRVVLSLLVVILSGAAGYFQWRKDRNNKVAHQHIADSILPPEDFQGAVVLVCGDSESLFSASVLFRETRQGWYLQVKAPEQLPLLAQHLAEVRPALIAQISVLLTVVPEQHQDEDDFIQKLRIWHRAMVQCKGWLAGIPPMWIGIWISPPAMESTETERWYTATPGQKAIQMREAGAVVIPLVEWEREQDGRNIQEKLSSVFWIESLVAWAKTHVQDVLAQRQGDLPALIPCAWGPA